MSDAHGPTPRFAWLLAAVILGAWTARVVAYPVIDDALRDPTTRRIASEAIRFAVMAALPVLLVLVLERRPIARPFGLPEPTRPELAWVMVGVWLVLLPTTEVMIRGGLPPLALPSVGALAGIAVAMILVSIAEEIAFRGVLLPRLVARHGAALGMVATALLFVLLHWPGWFLLAGLGPGEVMLQSAQIFFFALFLGAVTWLSGSLVPAIALHAANNLLVAVVLRTGPV